MSQKFQKVLNRYTNSGVINYILTEKGGTKYYFDLNGGSDLRFISKIEDNNGNKLLFSYNSQAINGVQTYTTLVSVIDDFNRSITFQYDSVKTDRLNSVTDPAGRITQYFYDDTNGNLLSVTGSGEYHAQYHYIQNGNMYYLDSYSDPRFPKGTKKRTIKYVTSVDKFRATKIFDGYNSSTAIDDNLVLLVNYFFSNDELQTADVVVNDKNPDTIKTTTYVFDNGKWIQTKDALNNITSFTWDGSYNQLTVTDPLNRTTEYLYDSYGNRLQSITHTGTRNVTSSSTYSTNSTHISNNLTGLLVKTVDPVGKISLSEYDANGNLVSIKTQKPSGALTEENTFISVVNMYNTNGQITTTVEYLSLPQKSGHYEEVVLI